MGLSNLYSAGKFIFIKDVDIMTIILMVSSEFKKKLMTSLLSPVFMLWSFEIKYKIFYIILYKTYFL